MQFKYGGVFLRKHAKHSFENALLVRCHFSRIPQIGLMFVARFSWVPNLYNLHFLLENHRPQSDPVNPYRDYYIILYKHMKRLRRFVDFVDCMGGMSVCPRCWRRYEEQLEWALARFSKVQSSQIESHPVTRSAGHKSFRKDGSLSLDSFSKAPIRTESNPRRYISLYQFIIVHYDSLIYPIWRSCSAHFQVQAFEITLFVPDVKQIIQSVKGAMTLACKMGGAATLQHLVSRCLYYLNSNLSSNI